MKTLRLCVIFALCCLTSASWARAKDATDPQEELKTAIPAAIKLLEDKEVETFLKKYVPPDDLERFSKKISFAKLAETYSKEKAANMLEALKDIKDREPNLESDGKMAIYQLKKEILRGKKRLIFIKIDKLWYIKN